MVLGFGIKFSGGTFSLKLHLKKENKMDAEFLVEEARPDLIRVTHRQRAATITFMIEHRQLLGAVTSEKEPFDKALDDDARVFAADEAVKRGLIDAPAAP